MYRSTRMHDVVRSYRSVVFSADGATSRPNDSPYVSAHRPQQASTPNHVEAGLPVMRVKGPHSCHIRIVKITAGRWRTLQPANR